MKIKHTYIQDKKVYKIDVEEMSYEQWIELINKYIVDRMTFGCNFASSNNDNTKITIKNESGFPTIKIRKGKHCELHQVVDFIPNLRLLVDNDDNINSYLRDSFTHICVKDTTSSIDEHELFKYEIQSNSSETILNKLLEELLPFIQSKHKTDYRVDSYRMDKLDTSVLRFTILKEYDLRTILNVIKKFAFENQIRHNIIAAEIYPIETVEK